MKFKIEIEMGNEAMQTVFDVREAIAGALGRLNDDHTVSTGWALTRGAIRDVHGNTVGHWTVTE